MLKVVAVESTRVEMRSAIDEIVAEGARRMLAAALEAEVDAYIDGLAGERDERGRRLVVRNGHADARVIKTAAGGIEIEAPRVNDKRVDPDSGERMAFKSVIGTPYACPNNKRNTDTAGRTICWTLSMSDWPNL